MSAAKKRADRVVAPTGANSTSPTSNDRKGAATVSVPANGAANLGALTRLPVQLRRLPHWLLWRYGPGDSKGRRPKVPHYVDGTRRRGTQGGKQDRYKLAPFEDALAALQREPQRWEGIGLAILSDSNLVALDFDNKNEPPTLNPVSEAEVREQFSSTYAERSPSGRGFRVFATGSAPEVHGGARGIEVFVQRKFVTVTGDALEGMPCHVVALTDAQREWLGVQAKRPDLERADAPGDNDWAHRANVPEATVRAALARISADCAYDVWVKYGQALKLEYGEAGWSIWNDWSLSAPTVYPGEYECRAKWKSFGKSLPANPVTVRSILKDAGLESLPQLASAAGASTLVTTSAADIEPENVDWLWPSRLPRRFLTVFAADSASGKSNCTAAITAALTTGAPWPDDDPRAPRRQPTNVLWLGVEDPPAQMTVPRLMAAGADLRRVDFLDGVRHPGTEGPTMFSLQDDLAALRRWLRKMRQKGQPVSLIVVDPVTAYLEGKRRIDPHKATELRSVLTPFAALADEEDIAVICITHLTKDKARGFIDSVLGSQALVALARNVWGFARVPGEGDASFAMFWGKGNLGPPGRTLRYSIEEAFVSKEWKEELVMTSKVVWGAVDATISKDTIFGGARGPLPTVRLEVEAWLRVRLGDGDWHDAGSVKREAEAAGFSEASTLRASKSVCEKKPAHGRAFWRLRQ